MIANVFAAVFAIALQSAASQSLTFTIPEAAPAGLDCVYRRLSQEDRTVSQQMVVQHIEAAARGDSGQRQAKDPTEKERKKRSAVLSGQCQEEFNFEDWQMNDWIAKYTNALNVVDAVLPFVDNSDAARIRQTVASLSPAAFTKLRDKQDKNKDAVIIPLIQAIFKTDTPLDKKHLMYSVLYLQSLTTIRDVRLRWSDWRAAEDAKTKAKAQVRAK